MLKETKTWQIEPQNWRFAPFILHPFKNSDL